MADGSLNVALCGYGYWGVNLFRNFSNSDQFRIVAVADEREDRRDIVKRLNPDIKLYKSAFEAIDAPDVQAVAIATPVASHYKLAARALLHGKHVFVEKPMCASSEEAGELVSLASLTGATLMVDHTFLFHPAVRKIKNMIMQGEIGRITYYDSQRINLGLFQPDVNVLWDLAPHDLSIIDYLFDEAPIHVQANGYCHLNPRLPDVAYMTMHFPSRFVAHLNLSWMSPVKVRRTAIGGTSKMVVWDDLSRDEPIRIYDSGINVLAQEDRQVVIPSYRVGEVHIPRLAGGEPLALAIEHFGSVIRGVEQSIMDGKKGLRIVRMLEWAQRSLDNSLADIDNLSSSNYPIAVGQKA